MKLASRLARASAFSHGEDHLRIKTAHGGIITLLGASLALFLFFAEANRCFTQRMVQEMAVDTSIRPTMKIIYDLTFPALPCGAIRLDTGDVAGNFETESMHQAVHDGEIHKYKLDRFGTRKERAEYIPVKGRDNPFVLTLDESDLREIRTGVMQHEGCRVHGWLQVQRVAGNLHFAVRPEAMIAVEESEEALQALFERHVALHDLVEDFHEAEQLNISHTINKLRFGDEEYPSQIHPLEGVSRIDRKATGIDKYFIKVVPVEYKTPWSYYINTYAYSVTEYYTTLPKGARQPPGIYILYDTWPIEVKLRPQRLGLLHFLVRACAVCGGVWAVTGAADRLVHKAVTSMKKVTRRTSAP